MRIAGATILTKDISVPANTVYSLIDYHPVADAQVLDGATRFFNHTTNFVSQDLRLQRKRDRLTSLVCVVVGMAGKNMGVSAAESDRGNAHQHLMRGDYRSGHITHFDPSHIPEHTRAHGLAGVGGKGPPVFECRRAHSIESTFICHCDC